VRQTKKHVLNNYRQPLQDPGPRASPRSLALRKGFSPQRQRGVKNPIARANSMNPPKAQTAMFTGLIIVVLFFYGTSAALFGPMIALS
jgi:hypothetical protein